MFGEELLEVVDLLELEKSVFLVDPLALEFGVEKVSGERMLYGVAYQSVHVCLD